MDRSIEAERLAKKVATASRQVLGPHHNFTIEADKLLDKSAKYVLLVFCPVSNYSGLCDTKMMEKYALSLDPLHS